MAIKLADTLAPMADFPAAMAEHIEFSDGENLQEKLDNGSLGGGVVKNYLRLKGTVGYEPQIVEITPSLVQSVLTNATSETIEGRWILEEAETNTEIFDTDGNFSLPALEKVTVTKLDDFKVLGVTDITSTAISCRAIVDIDTPFEIILEWKEENGAGHIELTQAEYDALSEDEKMNGSVYFITDAEGDENNVKDFYYKTLPTEPLVFSQGSVAIRQDSATELAYEYLDESLTNRIKTDEYINCNDLYYEINVPSEYTLMTRAYTKDDDGNMIALTNIPEFNGVFTIKDIIYSRVSVPSAPATQEEILGCYRQNNLYFRFCLKRLDDADFTPETNEVMLLKYTEEANKDALKSYVLSEDYLYNSIYYDYNRQIKNITGFNNLNGFIESIINKPDFDGTLVLPRRTYKMSYAIRIDASKIKVFDGNNAEFIMASANDRAAFEVVGSLDSSMTSNPNTLNTEIMNKEPNTIIRNCIIRGDNNEDGTYKNNGTGIALSGAIKTKIENCYIHHMAAGIKLTNVCRNISICNNHIYAIAGNGISLDEVNLHQVNINNNFITYCMNCLYVRPKELANLQLCGNDIEIGVYPDGYENARCLNFDISSTSNSCFEIEITGNTIQGHSASSSIIQFLGGTNPIKNVSIVGNHISNSNGTGIVLQDCKGFAIQGNTMKDIAGYIYDLRGTVSYTNIQGNVGSENCNNVITTPTSAVLEHVTYVDNTTTGSTTSILTTQKTDVVIQLEANNGKAYTKLEELGLTADATLDDAIEKLKGGQNATLSTKDFTNYQTLFPYSEEQDAYASVRIEKSFDTSRTIVTWVRKDGSKVAYGNLSSNNKVVSWHQYALKSYVDSKHKYSTDEVAIGTWIDGKTIYRKTFTKSPSSNQATGNTVTIDVATISGLTNVIDIQATAKLQNYNNTSAPIYAKIPFGEIWRSTTSSSAAYVDSVYVEGTTLKIHANNCVPEDIYYVTVEYTK